MSVWSTISTALERIAGAIGLSALLGDRATAFSTGVVALGAKMAVADGVVTRIEIDAFRRVFDVAAEDEARVMALFDLARRDAAGAEAYAARIGQLFADEPDTREDLLAALFFIAAADGVVHPAELGFLERVGAALAIPSGAFRRIEARHVRAASNPYAILGLEPGASVEAVRAARRRLAALHHPDRAVARGLPPEAARLEEETLARINAAADAIIAGEQGR